MICTLIKGAMLFAAASHIGTAEFKPEYENGNRVFLKQNHHRIMFINETGAKPNPWAAQSTCRDQRYHRAFDG